MVQETEPAADSRFSPSLIRAVANTAMGRQNVLPFWFGESDQSTPSFIREAAIASLRDGETFYSENLGRPYLRQAISTYLTDLHHLPIGTGRIAVTASGVSALMLVSQLLVAPGDRVVTVTPLWPNAVEIPKVMSGRVTCVSLEVQHGRWTLPLEKLLHTLTPGTRMLVLNSPNNPTGWTIRRAEQVAILEHCRRHGIWIIADDVYERLVYADGMKTAPSFLTLAEPGERLIVVNSFSKAWSMTGWRLGWMVVPPAIQDDLGSLLEYNTSCVSEFIQRAGVIALQQGEPYVRQLRAQLASTKEKLFAALSPFPGCKYPKRTVRCISFCGLPAKRFRTPGQSPDRRSRPGPRAWQGLRPRRRRLAVLVLCGRQQKDRVCNRAPGAFLVKITRMSRREPCTPSKCSP